MKKERNRKKYEKPKITFQKEIETLAAYCDSLHTYGDGLCKTGGCDRPQT